MRPSQGLRSGEEAGATPARATEDAVRLTLRADCGVTSKSKYLSGQRLVARRSAISAASAVLTFACRSPSVLRIAMPTPPSARVGQEDRFADLARSPCPPAVFRKLSPDTTDEPNAMSPRPAASSR